MPLVYRIHPAIGIARVGRSSSAPFIAIEEKDTDPGEADGSVFKGYKGPDHLMRRQAARFRVFEYDIDQANEREVFVREIDPATAEVSWTVQMAAAKAAGQMMTQGSGPRGARIVIPDFTRKRNRPPAGMTDADLIGSVNYHLTGPSQSPPASLSSIAGLQVMIGSANTDAEGRLVVAGGLGVSQSWATPPEPVTEFLNNETWFDDIADGPIDAVVTFPDGRVEQAVGAWVVVGPPDFAPDIEGLVTLADVAVDVAGLGPSEVEFDRDIFPLLQRADRLRWTNDKALWRRFAAHLSDNRLRDPSAAARPARDSAAADLLRAEGVLQDLRFTDTQRRIIDAFRLGNFVAGPTTVQRDPGRALDEAHLTSCVGGGFFPGIEMGVLATLPSVYSGPFRLTRGSFADHDGAQRTLVPGMISQRMACPWQADFLECEGNWWPAQRPDVVRILETGQTTDEPWARGVQTGDTRADYLNMIDSFARLGVVVERNVGGEVVLMELDRDPTL